MCLYYSVAINIEIDLLEVLDLNQIANFFLRRMQARPLCVKVCIKLINQVCLHVRSTDVLLVACKNKGNKAHAMGHKLTCAQALLTCFKILQNLILICFVL